MANCATPKASTPSTARRASIATQTIPRLPIRAAPSLPGLRLRDQARTRAALPPQLNPRRWRRLLLPLRVHKGAIGPTRFECTDALIACASSRTRLQDCAHKDWYLPTMPAPEGRLPGNAYPDPPGRRLNTTGEAAWRRPRADWRHVPARRALPPLASRWRPTLVPTVSDPLPGPMPAMLPARFEGSQTITACHPRRACAPWREPSQCAGAPFDPARIQEPDSVPSAGSG